MWRKSLHLNSTLPGNILFVFIVLSKKQNNSTEYRNVNLTLIENDYRGEWPLHYFQSSAHFTTDAFGFTRIFCFCVTVSICWLHILYRCWLLWTQLKWVPMMKTMTTQWKETSVHFLVESQLWWNKTRREKKRANNNRKTYEWLMTRF